MIKLLITGIVLLLFTCNSAEKAPQIVEKDSTVEVQQIITQKISEEDAAFLKFYQSFVVAIQSKKAVNVNAFIDEIFGVYFIESNGAMPRFTRQYDVTKFKSVYGKMFFELNFTKLNQQPIFEELPKIICDSTPYDKQGCFVKKINPFINDEFWYYTDLNEKEKQAISIFAEKINYTVIHTSTGNFYFIKNDDSWKIGFIDLRTPCEA